MKHLSALIVIMLLPMFGHAALLKYEFEFKPFSWPPELYPVIPDGNGHLIADTELDAVVGGELVSDWFHFVWTDPAPTPITYGYSHIGWHVAIGGNFQGIDVMSGVAGNLSLFFYLPPDLDNYSEALDQHLHHADVYWDLKFPDYGPPADQWEYHDGLWFDIRISSPTVISDTPVSEPATLFLLSLGLAAIVGIRARRAW